jgi:hypothetical protein
MKHYNFRPPGYSGKSMPPMTPKLHAEVSSKLQKIWGPYAGWAHSVLFTADLRAFAGNEGKPTILTPPDSPMSSTGKPEEVNLPAEPNITPRARKRKLASFYTPSPSPSLRKVRSTVSDQPTVHGNINSVSSASMTVANSSSDYPIPSSISDTRVESVGTTLAERIKLRSRGRRIG